MSISQVVSINQKNMPNFGENQGIWEYKTIDNEFLCYIVRKTNEQGKYFNTITMQNGKWTYKWFADTPKPLYNLQLLRLFPDKPVLIVEGEKTADAAFFLFPEFNVLSWMGGSKSTKKIEIDYLAGLKIYLLPDNDKPGYEGMSDLKDRLLPIALSVYFIDIKKLPVPDKWDLADLDIGDVDLEDIKILINETKQVKYDQSAFDTSSYPFMSEGDKPYALDVTENLEYLLSYFQISNKWNMMKRERETIIPGKKLYNEEEANESLTLITNLAVKYKFNIRRIDKHLDAIAFKDRFHPIRDWILSAPLQDKTIFDKFLCILKTTNDELSRLLLKKWLISAIATLFNESNYCAQGVLVLQGAGGWQKTSFIASLAPSEIDAVCVGAILDPSNKDCIISLSEYWIAELGELGSTFKKSDIDRLKGHITKAKDKIRRPFAAKNSKMLRRTIFAASVNEENFLVDETGNRRWWVISLTEKINLEHGLDMQQVWRAAYDLWLEGEKPYLQDNELNILNDSNEEFEIIEPFRERVIERFDFTENHDRWHSPTMVLELIGFLNPSRSDATKMGSILKKMGITKKRDKHGALYLMPILKNKYR